MRGRWIVSVAVIALVQGPGSAGAQDAAGLLDAGLRAMGGRERIEASTRVRFDMLTQWQRFTFEDVPNGDRPSFERHTDVRDYAIPAWRNTRIFGFTADARSLVNVIRDSIAVTDMGQGFRPLSVAYVDERRELFAYTPDRLMLHARSAGDLAFAGDTTVAGVPHARVRATVLGIPMTLHLRTADGLPTFIAFRRGHPNDFGLVPWGEMDVEVWYSGWRSFPEGVSIPTQWDIRRAGSPYKRMTVLAADFDPEFTAADSFAVSDALRATYLASPAVRPMHDLHPDSAGVLEGGFLVDFRTFGGPAGALRMGDGWLLLDAGQAPLSTARALDWLEEHTGRRAHGALVLGSVRGLFGGIPELLERDLPVRVGPASRRQAAHALRGHGLGAGALKDALEGGWLVFGADSARVERVDLPDVPGAAVLWAPAHRWLWAPDVVTPLDLALVLRHALERGWAVERVGTMRGLLQPIPR